MSQWMCALCCLSTQIILEPASHSRQVLFSWQTCHRMGHQTRRPLSTCSDQQVRCHTGYVVRCVFAQLNPSCSIALGKDAFAEDKSRAVCISVWVNGRHRCQTRRGVHWSDPVPVLINAPCDALSVNGPDAMDIPRAPRSLIPPRDVARDDAASSDPVTCPSSAETSPTTAQAATHDDAVLIDLCRDSSGSRVVVKSVQRQTNFFGLFLNH